MMTAVRLLLLMLSLVIGRHHRLESILRTSRSTRGHHLRGGVVSTGKARVQMRWRLGGEGRAHTVMSRVHRHGHVDGT